MDDLHKVEEHQARVKRAIAGNATVFALLLLCAKHEVEAVLAVVFERCGFVVGIHDKIATSGLVLIIDEPTLDAVHKLRAYMSAHIAAVYAEASDKDGWVYHVAFGLRYGFADTFSAGVREMVCEYAGVGDCKCADLAWTGKAVPGRMGPGHRGLQFLCLLPEGAGENRGNISYGMSGRMPSRVVSPGAE